MTPAPAGNAASRSAGKATRSRRGRITREAILDAALRLADDNGVDAITIRNIAERLELSPMGLYRHFRTKDEIIEGLGALAWEILDRQTSPDIAWDEQLRQAFSHMHRTLLEHPGLVDVLLLRPVRGLPVYRMIERLLAVLRGAGFAEGDAIAAIVSLESYTFGFVVQQRARGRSDPREFHSALGDLSAEEFPHLVGAGAAYARWTSENSFAVGLDRAIRHLHRDLESDTGTLN